MIVYLDTSVILRVLLAQRGRLKQWGDWEAAYTSELFQVEARRVVDRLRLESALDDAGVVRAHDLLSQIEQSVGLIRLTRPVLRRASQPMGIAVKTLDALHLASALLFWERRGPKPYFATHDRQQASAARALGFSAIGI